MAIIGIDFGVDYQTVHVSCPLYNYKILISWAAPKPNFEINNRSRGKQSLQPFSDKAPSTSWLLGSVAAILSSDISGALENGCMALVFFHAVS